MYGRIMAVVILVAAAASGLVTVCSAHGVSYEMIESSPAVTFKSGFSSGEPISYGEVLIYSPADREVEYQNGRTDRNGVFSFLPDRAGIWKVEVEGGLGHKLMFDVPVSAAGNDGAVKAETISAPGKSKTVSALLGVSLLLNVALAAMYLRTKRQTLN